MSHLHALQRCWPSQFGPADISRWQACSFVSWWRWVLWVTGQCRIGLVIRASATAITLCSFHKLWLHLFWNNYRDRKTERHRARKRGREKETETDYTVWLYVGQWSSRLRAADSQRGTKQKIKGLSQDVSHKNPLQQNQDHKHHETSRVHNPAQELLSWTK